MNILTQSRLSLIARIQQITQANGYRTDIGFDVRTGWLNELLQQDKLPAKFALVQRAKNNPPERGPGSLKAQPGFFVIGLASVDLIAYEDAIDDMEIDICQALMPPLGHFPAWCPKGVTGLTLGAPEQFPPGNGQRHAGVLVPVHFTTHIQEHKRR